MNSRSPGWGSTPDTDGPARIWSTVTRGIDTPICAYAACTSDEQSQASGPVAPHTYALPSWERMNATTGATAVADTGAPVATASP